MNEYFNFLGINSIYIAKAIKHFDIFTTETLILFNNVLSNDILNNTEFNKIVLDSLYEYQYNNVIELNRNNKFLTITFDKDRILTLNIGIYVNEYKLSIIERHI